MRHYMSIDAFAPYFSLSYLDWLKGPLRRLCWCQYGLQPQKCHARIAFLRTSLIADKVPATTANFQQNWTFWSSCILPNEFFFIMVADSAGTHFLQKLDNGSLASKYNPNYLRVVHIQIILVLNWLQWALSLWCVCIIVTIFWAKKMATNMTRFPQTLCFGDIGKAKIAEIMIWINWQQRLQQSLRVLLPNAPSLCFGNFGKAKMLRTVTWIFIHNLKLPKPLRLLLPNAPSARGPGKHVLVLQQSDYEKRKWWDYNCKEDHILILEKIRILRN